MNEIAKTFTLDQLCALVEMPKRTVRYYIQQGLVDRPEGANRGARYAARHVEQLLAVRKWKDAGLSLERIGELLAAPGQGEMPPPRPRRLGDLEVWSRLHIADGVELSIEPSRAGLDPAQVRELTRRILRACTDLTAPKEEPS